jgi:hypothetical protein
MQEEQKLFGKLFDTIPLVSEDHMNVIQQTLDKETALYMLVQAVKYAYHNNQYTLAEAEIISKSIRLLSC